MEKAKTEKAERERQNDEKREDCIIAIFLITRGMFYIKMDIIWYYCKILKHWR